MRFEQTNMTGWILREGECIQFTGDNQAEMEEFGCDVDGDEVTAWHEGDYDSGWSEDVECGDWVLSPDNSEALHVYSDERFHEKFKLAW